MASFDGSSSSHSGNGKENTSEVEEMYRKFTHKCLQIIVLSRIDKSELTKEKIHYNHDFSLMLMDNGRVDDQVRKALQSVGSFPYRSQSLCVEVSLVTNDGDHMFLETWDITFDPSSIDVAVNKPQHIYTRMGVTLKSLLCATRTTPAYKLARNQGERGGGYKLNYRFYMGKPQTHMLGEGSKTCRAGAVPSNSGLLAVTVSFRTRLLLSPDTTQSEHVGIQMQDNHFHQESRARRLSPHATHQISPHTTTHHLSTHRVSPPSFTQQTSPHSKPQVSPHKSKPASSRPQSCSSPHKSPVRSDSSGGESPAFCFAVSPGTDKEEDFMRIHLEAAQRNDQWSAQSHSVFTMDDLPEPIFGAFTDAHLNNVPEVTSSNLYQGLLKKSQIAQEMVSTLKQQNNSGSEDESVFDKTSHRHGGGEEKENIPNTATVPGHHQHTGRRGYSMEEVEEDYIMKPPFAEEDDPNDVKCFLGLMLQPREISFDVPGDSQTVDDLIDDVSRLVDRSERDMAELDRFCQGFCSLGEEERDTSPTS